MALYQNNTYSNTNLQIGETFASVMRYVYLWMSLGLFVTAITAALIVYTPLVAIIFMLAKYPILFYALLIGEIALVASLNARIQKMELSTARMWFIIYAIINGVTLSFIFLAYTLSSVAFTFAATASLFGVMSLIGFTTKMDLSKWGSYLLMGLIGLLIASAINIFFANSQLEWIITYAGIFLFLALTIYDTQRIMKRVVVATQAGETRIVQRIGLLGALSLYLNFINLFLKLLRLFGRRRRH